MSKSKSNTRKRSNGTLAFSIVVLAVFTILIVLGTVFAFVSLDNGELGIYNYKAYPTCIKLGLDLSGGAYAVYEVDRDNLPESMTDGENDEQEIEMAIEGTRASLESLLFNKGYTEAQVSVYGDTIRVEVPDIDDPERIFELIGRPSSLEFKEYTDSETVNETLMTGEEIAQTGVTYNSETGYYEVALKFTSTGSDKFAEITSDLTGKYLGIYINGEYVMHASVSEAISGGQCSISGKYSYDDAYALAVQIQAGSFPLQLNMRESSTLTATLGDSAIKAGVIAGIAGLILIVIYLVAIYRLMGVAASIALAYYTLTYVFFLSVFPWVQLTLSGIAGILLSMGMAVDANVIIFERIKEEYAGGKRMNEAISLGFRRSLGAIIDGNVTTIIGAVVLMLVGASTIKGFGITLFIGIVLSLITSLLITRLILKAITGFFVDKNKVGSNMIDPKYGKYFALKLGEVQDEEEPAVEVATENAEGGATL